jgi:hypothetical protein
MIVTISMPISRHSLGGVINTVLKRIVPALQSFLKTNPWQFKDLLNMPVNGTITVHVGSCRDKRLNVERFSGKISVFPA